MEFSRLDDTKFPILETASPYALKNTFDYTRWVPNTKIKLVNVLWNSDYSNVVKFQSDTARDSWFDSIEDSYTVTLTSNARMVPGGQIKLPLPYDVAAKYNYMYVDIPIATAKEQMIENETQTGKRRWYFFIGDIAYSAPNTTIMYLQADIWTNFINQSSVRYMMLERGHAPVAKTDTDEYLANPIANNRYLLAPDVSFDDSSVVRDSKYVPFGDGEKWMCFASTYGFDAMKHGYMGQNTAQANRGFIPPSFSDNGTGWNAYKQVVNGYTFNDGWDYSTSKAWVDPYLAVDGNEPNGLCVYAVPGSDAMYFLTDVMDSCPVFLRTVQAMFVVDRAMFEVQEEVAFMGHTLSVVYGANRALDGYALEKSMFGFTEEEQRFAKLYTYPYSRLEVSDNSGKTVEVRIENTGKIGMREMVSLAFPVLNCRVFLTGINGVGSQSYAWKAISGKEFQRLMPNGDWDKLTFELSIPTYSLYMDSDTAYWLDNYGSVQNARAQALTAYYNSVTSSNSDYANSVASANTARWNAERTANAAQANSNATANFNKANTDNLNECNRKNVNLTIAANSANTTSANDTAAAIMRRNNQQAVNDNTSSNRLSIYSTAVENQVSITTTANTAEANIQTSVASGAVSGAAGAMGNPAAAAVGAIAGGVLGAYTSGVTAHAANSNAVLTSQANADVTNATTVYNSEIVSRHVLTASQNTLGVSGNNGMTGGDNPNRTAQTDNTNSALAGQRDNNYNTTKTNAENTQRCSKNNAARTNSAATTNARETQSTSNSNSERSRDGQVTSAGRTLSTAQTVQYNLWKDAQRGEPVKLTDYTGDGENWVLCQNGVQFRLRTQSDSAIAQASAQFARFGYKLNQLWDVQGTGLTLMKNFTFWKASDIWVDVRNVAGSEVCDAIGDMFRNGVTVWSNPDKIGKVGIYDN